MKLYNFFFIFHCACTCMSCRQTILHKNQSLIQTDFKKYEENRFASQDKLMAKQNTFINRDVKNW